MNADPSPETTGALLMGYGSPNGAEDLPSYLTEVLHGHPASAEMVAEYVRRYELIGGSPQNRILASLREKLERRLGRDRPGTRVFLGVKHGHPALRDVIPEAARAGFRHLIAVPLSPYASTWISEPYREGVAEGIRAAATPIDVDVRLDWHLDPNWIGYWDRAIRADRAAHPDPTGGQLAFRGRDQELIRGVEVTDSISLNMAGSGYASILLANSLPQISWICGWTTPSRPLFASHSLMEWS